MSVYITGPVWKLKLEPKRKIVLLKLADCANPHSGFAFPAVGTIARDTGVAKPTVQLILAEFRDAGVLIVEDPGGGRRKATTYSIDLEMAQQLHGFPASVGDEKSAANDGKGANPNTKPRKAAAPEPKGTVEPSRARGRPGG